MKVSGFTYMRNSFKYGYPVIESIKSILPICDEFIAVVGDSSDGTREAIEAIGSDKIRIIDTIWDNQLRKEGKIFAQQTNIGLKELTGDWAFHIQSDEVIHEKDLTTIYKAMDNNLADERVDGFLFNFLHFIGDYKHIATSRRWHRREIRIVRNRPDIYSYRDSQGFRSYPTTQDALSNTNSRKLNVKKLNVPIFHYSYCRHPSLLLQKVKQFLSYYTSTAVDESDLKPNDTYDFSSIIDVLDDYLESHPKVMEEKIANQNWNFAHDPSKNVFTLRQKLLHSIESWTGWRIGEYKNYKVI